VIDMTEKRIIRLVHDQARRIAAELCMSCPDGWIAKFSEPTRSLEQNAAQWPMLECFAKQKQWPVNGALEWLTKEEWKDILTAAFKKEVVRISPGIDGGMVLLGLRTSKFKVREFSDWLEFLNATAAIYGIDTKIDL